MATLSYKSDITRANTITNTVICNNEQQQNQEEKYNDSYYLSYCYYHPTYHKVYFTTIQQELYNKRTMVPIYVYISSFIATSLVIILSFFPFVNVSSLIVCSCFIGLLLLFYFYNLCFVSFSMQKDLFCE